ncbi:hypothetical protein BHE74_00053114 [Ensete ventricosum]|nr:hypothetical protein BHE74_00053114 [Ensete ventricosum]
MHYPRAILRPRMTREWVGEGELANERMQSEVAEALRCSHGGDLIIQRYDGVTRELDYSNSYVHLRELDKLEDKVEAKIQILSVPKVLVSKTVFWAV